MAPHGIVATRVVTTRAVNGISPLVYSSFHSWPRKFAEAGLSSLALRNGFAANAGTASRIDIVRARSRNEFFMRPMLTGDVLTLHVRNSQSSAYATRAENFTVSTERKFETKTNRIPMKRFFLFLLAVSLPCFLSFSQQYPGGIVYGPKAAFNIGAPKGWVLDNESGQEQGLPCVLYPKGQSWANAKTVMYAKIAGTEF